MIKYSIVVCCYEKNLGINTETCRSNFNIHLHYLLVHMLVYNKHLLFNVHGMNIKVINTHFNIIPRPRLVFRVVYVPTKTFYTFLSSPVRVICPAYLILLHLFIRRVYGKHLRSLSSTNITSPWRDLRVQRAFVMTYTSALTAIFDPWALVSF